MKSFRIALSVAVFLLALLILAMPGLSLETSVLMTTEHNLSIDIGPEYLLGSRSIIQSDDGSVFQVVVINNSSDGNATNATLMFYALPVYEEDPAKINATAFSEFLENSVIGLLKLTGWRLMGEESLKNKIGENVTLYSFNAQESEYLMAFWPIDSKNVIVLRSNLDDATNKQIIETLEVEFTRC